MATDVSSSVLRVDVQNGVGRLMLNRPEAANSLSVAMVDALAGALARLAQDQSLKALVLSAAGDRAFARALTSKSDAGSLWTKQGRF